MHFFLKPSISDIQRFLPNNGNTLSIIQHPLNVVRTGENEFCQVC